MLIGSAIAVPVTKTATGAPRGSAAVSGTGDAGDSDSTSGADGAGGADCADVLMQRQWLSFLLVVVPRQGDRGWCRESEGGVCEHRYRYRQGVPRRSSS